MDHRHRLAGAGRSPQHHRPAARRGGERQSEPSGAERQRSGTTRSQREQAEGVSNDDDPRPKARRGASPRERRGARRVGRRRRADPERGHQPGLDPHPPPSRHEPDDCEQPHGRSCMLSEQVRATMTAAPANPRSETPIPTGWNTFGTRRPGVMTGMYREGPPCIDVLPRFGACGHSDQDTCPVSAGIMPMFHVEHPWSPAIRHSFPSLPQDRAL